MLTLAVFRPNGQKLFTWPTIPRFAATACTGLIILAVTTPILAFNEPAKITSSYEILEPETWIGKELPILEHIDIGQKLETGKWLILLYHYDCPDCARAIAQYQQMARNLAGNEDLLQIALVEVPPYGQGLVVSQNSYSTHGQLAETKEWFVTTPAVVLLTGGKVKSAWEGKTPDFDAILQNIAKMQEMTEKSRLFSSTNNLTHSL